MLSCKYLSVLLVLGACSAQRFNNPVLEGADYPDPGVLYYNGTYYAVTTSNNYSKVEKYPIHSSKDLQNWKFEGYIFDESNFPVWSRVDDDFWAPEIHIIQGRFHIYFTARDVKSDLLAIGLATSNSVLGPYKPQQEAFLVVPGMWVVDSTVINHDGQLMLCWVGQRYIRVRNMTDDGMAFKDNNTVALFQPDLEWEADGTEGPWYLFRNGYHYIFYSGNDFCTDRYALGVARSSVSPAGPYEKHPTPFLWSNDIFKGPGHGSIVRDLDGKGYVYVHHGWKAGEVCQDYWRLMFSTTLFWGDDDWPKNMTIGD